MELPEDLKRFLLKDSDPSVRKVILQDVLGHPESDPALVEARRQLGKEGWAARILARQQEGGHWETFDGTDASLYRPKYLGTNWCLLQLAELGMDRSDPRIEKAVRLLLRTCGGPNGWFEKDGAHLCVTGNAVRYLTLLGYAEEPVVSRGIQWLESEQKSDGGWHCFDESTGTIDGWEAMAAFATVPQASRSPSLQRAIDKGAEFYLARGLVRESDGSASAFWHRFHYPTHYYYDLLVGLEFMTQLGFGQDPRLQPPLEELLSKRNPDGTWNLDAAHPDLEPNDPYYVGQMTRAPIHAVQLECLGAPSRWITARALRVLARVGRPVGP